MKELLKKLIRGVAYTGAALVIVLAIAVGIFRLMLPRLPEYQEEIKAWASSAIGMNVEFAGMNARWRLSGPELSFYGAGLNHNQTGISVLSAEEVSIGVGLWRLIADRELVVDRVTIRDTSIDLRQDGNGDWIVQGIAIDDLLGERDMLSGVGADIVLVGQNIDVGYEHPASGQLVPLTIQSIIVARSSAELGVEAEIELSDEFGERLEISANRRLGPAAADLWRIYVEADSMNLAGWSRLQQFALPEITSGSADFVLWFDLAEGQVDSASANVVIANLQADGQREDLPLGLLGSFEYSAEPDGWLLGANQMRIDTVQGDWPQTSMQLRVEHGDDGAIESLRGNTSFVDLDDLAYLDAWLPEEQRLLLADYQPSGIMRDFDIELRGIGSDMPEFDVSADLEQVGFAARDSRPGVRDFSGRVRADNDGGRIEIESTNLSLDIGEYLPEPVVLDDAIGTVIWRRNRDGMIVLSDSVQIRNADFDSQMSLQVSVPAGDGSPVIDYESAWSVFDVSAVRRYLPVKLMTPKLYQWLSDSLISGYVRRGTTRFNGAVADFPFDNNEGVFRIDAQLEDTVLRYAPDWPVPAFRHLDVVVENTRLYSEENSAENLGINIEDARVEIADLREPVLTIDTFATGSMQAIKTFVEQSPISRVFGGQLDRITVAGDSSFDLSIVLPIKNARAYDFTTRIRASDATVRIAGFPAAITGLNGAVTVSRETLSSESLFAEFLGSPVNLSLTRAADADAPHSVILSGTGRTTSEALQSELGIPFNGVVDGDADYAATLRFPNGSSSEPGPLQVLIESDLFGFQANLPAPLDKSDDETFPMTATIEFPSPDVITTSGSLAGEINWTGRFVNNNDAWDFDRGVVAIGENPREADVRGLHIHGQVSELNLHDWLAEGRRGNRETGLGQRIRRIDIGIGSLYAIGQRFTDHRIDVNRSGQDWVIQMTGPEAEGNITVPYDFTSGRPMMLEMERLIMPGNVTSTVGNRLKPIDPRSLPAISVRAEVFALGERRFGSLDVDFKHTARGLETDNLMTRQDSFTVSGNAGWIVDPYEELGQRTFITAALRSTNVQETFNQLAYDPGIVSDGMAIELDLEWAGGPRQDFMGALNGTVNVQLTAGTVAEVNPGAGRVFGLMSFTALPRRLSLDFSDVFQTGFGYDAITGDFRLLNGDAYTCNLTLTGPAADVGIVGRAGLLTRDYDQAAIVSANVGNTLPVAGFFLGGPQVAAALLVFSQVFRKPLKDMGQVFYSVAGSWDDPGINPADSQSFADVSARAGCLSPE
ncbi:MAG: YhdP family protein [Gammaproteobacteria bacterium]|nr:YhdP family protein [Gammaproteobacteria bacterium]